MLLELVATIIGIKHMDKMSKVKKQTLDTLQSTAVKHVELIEVIFEKK